MTFFIGFDIGGTKIAAAIYDSHGNEVAQRVQPTPDTYDSFLRVCAAFVHELEEGAGGKACIGVGMPGGLDPKTGEVFGAANNPCLTGKRFGQDLQKALARSVRFANDSNCMALGEAVDGAGAGYDSVFGLILGTGVGGGFVYKKALWEGANGMACEIGHLPLPFREDSDGVLTSCACGQVGCVEKSVCGAALARLYQGVSGQLLDSSHIAALAEAGDKTALAALDQYYTTLAKAMVVILHSYDPEVIVVGGGLSNLKGIYTEVPKRWGRYALSKNIRTVLVPARHGAMSGLRGAACLGRENI